MNAIERIQGFACEVTQEQWEELVRVADSVGVKVGSISRIDGIYSNKYPYAAITNRKNNLCTFPTREGNTLIPYHDFLSKLKGEEKWEPKNGEEVIVEIASAGNNTKLGNFVGMHGNLYVVKVIDAFHAFREVKPSPITIPTITRQEAEALINKRIID